MEILAKLLACSGISIIGYSLTTFFPIVSYPIGMFTGIAMIAMCRYADKE